MRSRKSKLFLPGGQSLIEIVVAVGIIVMVLVGVSDLITRSLGLASFQSGKNEAESIAQSQLIYYRLQRDAEPADFFLGDNPQQGYSLCTGEYDADKYECSIAYSDVANPDGVSMTVSVQWMDGDKEITTKLSQFLADTTK